MKTNNFDKDRKLPGMPQKADLTCYQNACRFLTKRCPYEDVEQKGL